MTSRAASVNWGDWPAWLDQAEADGIIPACRGADLDLFFPENGHTAMGKVTQAKRICARCVLKPTCKQWALDQPAHQLHGVWGGLSRAERLARRPRGEQPPQFRKHNN